MAEHPDPGGDPAVELQRLRQEVASQRVKLELAREGVARLEAILASASDVAIITIDPGGLVTSWNPGATNLLGWDEAEALGMDGRALFTPEDRERHAAEAETETALAEGRAADERWHMRKDGSRFRASGVMTPLQGGPEPGFLKVMRDVTAQRTAEAAASEGEARLRLITDHVPVQIGYLDREQRYRFANRPFADFLRTPPELLLGRTVREQVGEQTYARLRPWFLAALAGETVSFEDEEPDKHGPGLSGWTEETYVPAPGARRYRRGRLRPGGRHHRPQARRGRVAGERGAVPAVRRGHRRRALGRGRRVGPARISEPRLRDGLGRAPRRRDARPRPLGRAGPPRGPRAGAARPRRGPGRRADGDRVPHRPPVRRRGPLGQGRRLPDPWAERPDAARGRPRPGRHRPARRGRAADAPAPRAVPPGQEHADAHPLHGPADRPARRRRGRLHGHVRGPHRGAGRGARAADRERLAQHLPDGPPGGGAGRARRAAHPGRGRGPAAAPGYGAGLWC